MKILAAALLALAIASPDAVARCGPAHFPRSYLTKPQIIPLNAEARGVRDAPAFYLHFMRTTTLWFLTS
jgi:hypothetical protein